MNDYVVLRRAALSPAEAAIVRTVARAWSCGRRLTVRDLDCALPGVGVRYHLYGHKDRPRANLVELGWLRRECYVNRSLRPGWRFAGIDSDGGILTLREVEA